MNLSSIVRLSLATLAASMVLGMLADAADVADARALDFARYDARHTALDLDAIVFPVLPAPTGYGRGAYEGLTDTLYRMDCRAVGAYDRADVKPSEFGIDPAPGLRMNATKAEYAVYRADREDMARMARADLLEYLDRNPEVKAVETGPDAVGDPEYVRYVNGSVFPDSIAQDLYATYRAFDDATTGATFAREVTYTRGCACSDGIANVPGVTPDESPNAFKDSIWSREYDASTGEVETSKAVAAREANKAGAAPSVDALRCRAIRAAKKAARESATAFGTIRSEVGA